VQATGFASMRKLAIFAVISLIAHVLIVGDIRLPAWPTAEDPPPLRVRLQAAPALPPVLPRPAKIAQPSPAPAATPVAPIPEIATANAYDAPAINPATPRADEGAPTVAGTAPETPPAAAAPVENKPALARRLPRNGEITYQLYLGNNRFNVGRTRQSWSISDGRYRLSSASETTGVAALFVRQSIEYNSSGLLTADGLRPETFSNERVRSGKKDAASARFDRAAQTLTYGEPPRTAPLAANTQDLVSFMYQLGLLPLTPGRIELPITNGWKLERYELEIGSEQPLETPFGQLRAVPVKQLRRANEESIELWLAPAYRWLPVRIRFFGRDGEPAGEQIVSDIKVSEE
jgi:hypothetical protein